MSAESRDFITLREGEYARALSQCPEPVEVTPDVDEEACERCKGTGEVTIEVKLPTPTMIELVIETCPKCGGRGV